MSNATNDASSAERYARRARMGSDDEVTQNLARAVEYLAKAIAEVSKQIR
jgi:hypothetical protein